jgi:L-ribulose-5-phosphate 4-epimerase
MKAAGEGYIKFKCELTDANFEFKDHDFSNLERWRGKMFEMGLIGVYPDGIGFGNISLRAGSSSAFIISGSATGSHPHLCKDQYALVTHVNFEENSLICTARLNASSESMSHAVIYETCSLVNGVIHLHSKILWGQLINRIPTTLSTVTYGTPEMAYEIKRVIRENDLISAGLIVMGGHEEGIIAYGKDLDEAGKLILNLY